MKLKDLLTNRETLKRYDELVAELIDLHTSTLDSINTSSLQGVGDIVAFERNRLAKAERILHEIAKLDEE